MDVCGQSPGSWCYHMSDTPELSFVSEADKSHRGRGGDVITLCLAPPTTLTLSLVPEAEALRVGRQAYFSTLPRFLTIVMQINGNQS